MSWQQCVMVVFLALRVFVSIYDLVKHDRESALINFVGTVALYIVLKTCGFWG